MSWTYTRPHMKWRILKNDLNRNRLVSSILFVFIIFSTLLVAGSVTIISRLTGSVDNLFEKADALHFLQMHSGDIDQDEIDRFVVDNALVKKQQSIMMINIEGEHVFLTDDDISLSGSAIDLGFVRQSVGFDYLLDLDNEIIQVEDGQIAVPIHYMTTYDLSVGDRFHIRDGSYAKTFEISTFLRDSQMNSTLASSKRFLVSENDHADLEMHIGSIEYLIEFQLTDITRISEFAALYVAAGLPSQGPTIEYSLLRMINMISDGIMAAVIILAGVLLVLISMLCLRFVILATLEEDMQEIGVMKAIGVSYRDIRELYIVKYVVFAGIGCAFGYVFSLFFSHLFTRNITLYMGATERSVGTVIFPMIAVGLVFLLIMAYCRKLVRSIRKISAVEAMYPERIRKVKKKKSYVSIKTFRKMNHNTGIAFQDVFGRFKTFVSLLILYMTCVVLIIIPINLLNTLQSPDFIEYMGVSQSDIRIDLQHHEDTSDLLSDIAIKLENDHRVDQWSAFSTYKFKLQTDEESFLSIDVENGDFTIFPIEYLDGQYPLEDGEIALSYLWAQELGYRVGDSLTLQLPDETLISLSVTGIYQDITNGGKTAKAIFPNLGFDPVRSMVNIDVVHSKDIAQLQTDYKDAFADAKVTDTKDYLNQTYGSMIEQTEFVVILAVAISSVMFLLIVSLFLKLMLAKDIAQNAIMMSLGFSRRDIRLQYFKRIIGLLFVGIGSGIVVANTLGLIIVRMVFETMGLPKLRFVIHIFQVFVVIPVVLFVLLGIAAWIGTLSIKNISISTLNAE
jgi:putative ABC transport system permease protein